MRDNADNLIMGVGNGSGNLFVKGNYESITVLQNKLLELEELRRTVDELNKRLHEKDNKIINLELEVARLKNSDSCTPPLSPHFPKCPSQDVIWCSTSSLDVGNIKAKGF